MTDIFIPVQRSWSQTLWRFLWVGCLNLESSLQVAAFFIIGAYCIGGQAVPLVLGTSLGGYEDPGFSCPSSSCCMDQVELV
ncbi:hypothetical protein K443DRAFT_674749 [Laccaria amethystina LaAM-08-1]|uniref:Unplaced genomic scaffold K443scaffold_21, whole genome shotgun sequence n=1 Tax=Laccaria amethystina LaAM-08-1 TaxID=1095629 RepID=A0A0C9XLJ7_9AGAR|nr:hypothetical protein K443DRAFT_674749 [Laccaria amethystina LaAM-08-1]